MSRRRLDGEFELIRLLTEEGTEGVSRVCAPCRTSYSGDLLVRCGGGWSCGEAGAVEIRGSIEVETVCHVSAVDSELRVWIVVAGDLWSRYYGPMLAQYHVHITR